jgi:uracil-DNA glycosylase
VIRQVPSDSCTRSTVCTTLLPFEVDFTPTTALLPVIFTVWTVSAKMSTSLSSVLTTLSQVAPPVLSLAATLAAKILLQMLLAWWLVPYVERLSITFATVACSPAKLPAELAVPQPARATAEAIAIRDQRTPQSLRQSGLAAPAAGGDATGTGLAALAAEVTGCTRCPRLVAWREQVARERRAAFARQTYWGRPIPGFGDPAARVLILGLAPAAHGANRTGRIFTGDRSGDWLFAALHRTGFANQPTSTAVDDGLELRDCWVTAAVRCAPPANKPTPGERDRCLPFAVRELALLGEVRVIVCLGAFAWDAALRLRAASGEPPLRPRPRFGHGAESAPLLGCYHPSQQNTFTGRLTETMTDSVLLRARALADLDDV